VEEDEKEIRKEKYAIGLWALLLGLPLGLIFSAMFLMSGLYLEIGANSLFKFVDDIPNIAFLLITLPWSIGGFVAALIGGARLWRKKKSTRPIKIALANMTDLSIITNVTIIGIGVLFYNTFRPLYCRISYFALPVATWVSFFPPIVVVPLAVDFIMPRLWQAVFKHQYGFAEGRLLKNLTSASKKGELRRDFYKRTRFYLLAAVIIYVMTVVLVLLGFSR
jgi:hypothetical protein